MNFLFSPEFVSVFDKAILSEIGLALAVGLVIVLVAQLLPDNLAGGVIFSRSSLWFTVLVMALCVLIRFVVMLLTWELLFGLVGFFLLILLAMFLRKKDFSNNTPKEEETNEEASE